MVNTEKRLQLVKNEGHVLCHTKVAPGETGVVIPTLHTYTHKGECSMTTLILAADRIGLTSLADWFKRLAARLVHQSKVNATIKELSALSDAELRDIGLNRGDIYSIAHEAYLDNRGI